MKLITYIIIFVCCLFFAVTANAGVVGKYDKLYDKERFETADTNKDGVLDKKELRNAQKNFEYFMDNKRFRHADTNKDGVISFEEAKAQKQWEKRHAKKHRDRREDIRDRENNKVHRNINGK